MIQYEGASRHSVLIAALRHLFELTTDNRQLQQSCSSSNFELPTPNWAQRAPISDF
jgi:hypothetical protein